jgi:hypothetical protein
MHDVLLEAFRSEADAASRKEVMDRALAPRALFDRMGRSVEQETAQVPKLEHIPVDQTHSV